VRVKKRLVLLCFAACLALAAHIAFTPTYAGLEFYENLPGKYADCGAEIYKNHQRDRNSHMRPCFERAFHECRPAKLHQTGYTFEGDPIMTTALIEGKRQDRCIVRIHVNSRDDYGVKGSFQIVCRHVAYQTQRMMALKFSQCENGRDQWS